MVKMLNLGRDNHYIWCDYFPENDPQPGFIKVDLTNGEIVEKITAPYEVLLGSTMYAHHAMRKLITIQSLDPLPQITGAAWY